MRKRRRPVRWLSVARRFSTRPRAAGPKRMTNWIGSADQGFTVITTGAKQLNSTFSPDGGAGVVKAPLTITRTVGRITIGPQTLTASRDSIGAFGM